MRIVLLVIALLASLILGGGAVWEWTHPPKARPRNLNAELLHAAGEARPDKVRKLLKEGANPNATIGKTRLTAIHFAMVSPAGKRLKEEQRLAVARELIQAGANPHATIWPNGDTALVWAAGSGYPSIVRYLLRQKPSRTELKRARVIATRRAEMNTPDQPRYRQVVRLLGAA